MRNYTQIISSRGNFVEKIFRDSSGHLIRASFCVYEQDGRIKARLLNMVCLEQCSIVGNNFLVLGGATMDGKNYGGGNFAGKIFSPYFNTDLLYFLGVQPRAPAF